MTARNTSAQPAADPLPKRVPSKGLAGLIPQAADRTGDAPGTAPAVPEAAVAVREPGPEPPAEPAPEPLRPRDYNEVLDRRYPSTVGLTPGVPPGERIYSGEISAAFDHSLTEANRDCAAALREDHEDADRAHAVAHDGRRLPREWEACTYAAWAEEPPYRHHERRDVPTWYTAAPVLAAGEWDGYGVVADG